MVQLFKKNLLWIFLFFFLFNCSEKNEKIEYKIVSGMPIIDYKIFRDYYEPKLIKPKESDLVFCVIADFNYRDGGVKVYVFKDTCEKINNKDGYIVEIYSNVGFNKNCPFKLIEEYKLCAENIDRIDQLFNEFKPQEMCSIEWLDYELTRHLYIVHVQKENWINWFSINKVNLEKLDVNSKIAKEPQVVFVRTMIDFFNNLDKTNVSEYDSSDDTGNVTFKETMNHVPSWNDTISIDPDNSTKGYK